MRADPGRRRKLIREIIATAAPSSQKELVEMLSRRGIKVDQSTISRDLREMGVVRLPEGRYAFPEEALSPAGEEELERGMREYALSVEPSGNLVVVHTAPGNAHALAVVIDRARLREVAGTVAGDDTILVVAREGFKAAALAKELARKAGL